MTPNPISLLSKLEGRPPNKDSQCVGSLSSIYDELVIDPSGVTVYLSIRLIYTTSSPPNSLQRTRNKEGKV